MCPPTAAGLELENYRFAAVRPRPENSRSYLRLAITSGLRNDRIYRIYIRMHLHISWQMTIIFLVELGFGVQGSCVRFICRTVSPFGFQ
ncbi:hypothetical protein LIA77_04022 [Sarocladium implicatum]|nr:hypothetical protein LIA77_04022 [Sarocladium implicatum]